MVENVEKPRKGAGPGESPELSVCGLLGPKGLIKSERFYLLPLRVENIKNYFQI